MTAQKLDIAVNISNKVGFRTTALERLVMRLGGPEAVMSACNRLTFIIAVGALVYVIGWTALFSSVGLIGSPTSWTPVRLIILSLGWTAPLGFQVFLQSLRYAATTLLMKIADDHARLSESQFHARVAQAVNDGLDAYFRDTAMPPPTVN